MKLKKPKKIKSNQYTHSHHIVYSCKYHIVFTPKYRRKVLEKGVDKYLKKLLKEKQVEYGYTIIEMEVMPDHVHLLLDIDPRIGVNNVVAKIKGFTAHHLLRKFPQLRNRIPCLWTRSRFIASVGAVSLDVVKKYIEDQKNV